MEMESAQSSAIRTNRSRQASPQIGESPSPSPLQVKLKPNAISPGPSGVYTGFYQSASPGGSRHTSAGPSNRILPSIEGVLGQGDIDMGGMEDFPDDDGDYVEHDRSRASSSVKGKGKGVAPADEILRLLEKPRK